VGIFKKTTKTYISNSGFILKKLHGTPITYIKGPIGDKGLFARFDIDPEGCNIGLAWKTKSTIGKHTKDYRKTDLCKVVRHSKNPNIEVSFGKEDGWFITTKVIRRDEELFVDYGSYPWSGNTAMVKITANEKLSILQRRASILAGKISKITALREDAERLSQMTSKEITKQYGRILGRGSSRTTWPYNDKAVIKKARNDNGIHQNNTQFVVWSKADKNSRRLLTPIYCMSKDKNIIIAGYAEPLKRWTKSLKDAVGIIDYGDEDADGIWVDDMLCGDKWDFLESGDFAGQIYTDDCGTAFIGDFVKPSSWGKIGKRIVLLDYGW
jgi:hypothetical protein